MPVSIPLFSGLTRVATVPAGNLPNAALVGAKTVKGPAEFSVSTNPAALTAATNVVWSFELTAFWTMVRVGNIAAPPTMGFLATAGEPMASDAAMAMASADASFMNFPPFGAGPRLGSEG